GRRAGGGRRADAAEGVPSGPRSRSPRANRHDDAARRGRWYGAGRVRARKQPAATTSSRDVLPKDRVELSDYVPILIFFAGGLAVGGAILALSAIGRKTPNPVKELPYESGILATTPVRQRFSIDFYL